MAFPPSRVASSSSHWNCLSHLPPLTASFKPRHVSLLTESYQVRHTQQTRGTLVCVLEAVCTEEICLKFPPYERQWEPE